MYPNAACFTYSATSHIPRFPCYGQPPVTVLWVHRSYRIAHIKSVFTLACFTGCLGCSPVVYFYIAQLTCLEPLKINPNEKSLDLHLEVRHLENCAYSDGVHILVLLFPTSASKDL